MDISLIIMLLAGFFGGFIGAQVGSGAMITLPALLFLGLEPALAIGTNILSAWLINVTAAARYWKSKKLDLRRVIPLSVIAFGGSIIGSQITLAIDKDILSKMVAFLFLALIFLFFVRPRASLRTKKITKKTLIIACVLAFFLGIYGGFFSVGVTTFFIFLFIFFFSKDLLQAVASAVFVAAVFLVGAVLVFVLEDNIDYSLAVPLAASSIVGAYIGANTALEFGNKWLKFFLVAMIIALVVKLLFDYF